MNQYEELKIGKLPNNDHYRISPLKRNSSKQKLTPYETEINKIIREWSLNQELPRQNKLKPFNRKYAYGKKNVKWSNSSSKYTPENQKELGLHFKNNQLKKLQQQVKLNEGFTEYHIEKYANMINLDNDVLYLASSFISLFNSMKTPINTEKKSNLKQLPHLSCSIKSGNSYNFQSLNMLVNQNLAQLHNIKYPSSITSSRVASQNTFHTHLFNDDKLSEISAFSALSNQQSTIFGMKFPQLTPENFKQSLSIQDNYMIPNFFFWRIGFSTSVNSVQDCGFIEIEINQFERILIIHKLYVFKIYRKMNTYAGLLEEVFGSLFNLFPVVRAIEIQVIDKLDTYKQILIDQGFVLKQKKKVQNEYIDILIKKIK